MPVKASNEQLNWIAPEFNLKSIDNKYYKLNDLRGVNGTVIAFICNHCPYVIKIIDRLVDNALQLNTLGVATIGIMSNDVNAYPEDSFENMKIFSKKYSFNFHYLYDETQQTAKDYGAQCTPDIFGFNRNNILKYRGRLDSGLIKDNNKKIKKELFYAMETIINTNEGPLMQHNSMGCSIKWINNE